MIEPDDWSDCFSIETWIREWIPENSKAEADMTDYLDNSEKKEAFEYLEELMGEDWTNLTGRKRNAVWNCALTCRTAQLNAYFTASVKSSTMSASPSIRW